VLGYSRLMGADEEGTLERLKALRRELVDPKIAERRGASSRQPATGCSSSFRTSSTQCAARSDGSVAWPSATGEPADGRIDCRIGSPAAV
jgi:adenylate cyclase